MKWICFIALLCIFFSCQEEMEPLHVPPEFLETPNGFDDVLFPIDNEFTQARWDLGKKLFFDPIMSVDSSISCSSCHNPALAFSDNVAFSLGVEDRIGTRNAPSLANVSYHPYYTREGGVPTLEFQVLVPIQEHNEFDFNIVLLAERMSKQTEYVTMTQRAYDRDPDAFAITRSLACFERSLISGYSAYDHYAHYNDLTALNDSEIRGMDLFFSERTNCSKCHGGFNFTNYEFANNGLYLQYADSGRFRLTGLESDRALFKIASLRNIELTSPYMHDGSVNSLEEVIDHYNSGGRSNVQKSDLIKALDLSDLEKKDLVSFLKTLTDEHFINNPKFRN